MVSVAPVKDLNFDFARKPYRTKVTFLNHPDMNLEADIVFVDAKVASIHGGILPGGVKVIEIPGGELAKTPKTLQEIWKRMGEANLRRDQRALVIGGGTVCDICAFAASTWKRGIKLTLVPTTLLCMVDASLGGKTAANIGGRKNQAGTVYPAGEILIWPGFLETLPREELNNGIAEALKTAVIGNRNIVHYLKNEDYAESVKHCLMVKGGIVAEDLEESGRRKLLNLGHTAGHCIEASSRFSIPHGLAVAMGIPVAARMGGNNGFAEDFNEAAHSLGINTHIPGSITAQDAMVHLSADKKTLSTGRTWIIPENWEHCEMVNIHPDEERRLLTGSWR